MLYFLQKENFPVRFRDNNNFLDSYYIKNKELYAYKKCFTYRNSHFNTILVNKSVNRTMDRLHK